MRVDSTRARTAHGNRARHWIRGLLDDMIDSRAGGLSSWTHLSLAEILVLAGGPRPPAPAVPSSTRMCARLKRVGHTVQRGTCHLAVYLNISPANPALLILALL